VTRERIEFGVSGLLINSNLVMYDRRDGEMLYPQIIYTAINGQDQGRRLELLPAVETTWKYPDKDSEPRPSPQAPRGV
jgi:hypothetical protein